MGCGCKQPVIRNPKPETTTTNGESETTSTTGTTSN